MCAVVSVVGTVWNTTARKAVNCCPCCDPCFVHLRVSVTLALILCLFTVQRKQLNRGKCNYFLETNSKNTYLCFWKESSSSFETHTQEKLVSEKMLLKALLPCFVLPFPWDVLNQTTNFAVLGENSSFSVECTGPLSNALVHSCVASYSLCSADSCVMPPCWDMKGADIQLWNLISACLTRV